MEQPWRIYTWFQRAEKNFHIYTDSVLKYFEKNLLNILYSGHHSSYKYVGTPATNRHSVDFTVVIILLNVPEDIDNFWYESLLAELYTIITF